jgi:hypothetical protein
VATGTGTVELGLESGEELGVVSNVLGYSNIGSMMCNAAQRRVVRVRVRVRAESGGPLGGQSRGPRVLGRVVG